MTMTMTMTMVMDDASDFFRRDFYLEDEFKAEDFYLTILHEEIEGNGQLPRIRKKLKIVGGARGRKILMADVTSDYDCAVIDEIQMLGCRTRGFSFTRALLGISANDLHLCGDAAAVPLIQEILSVTGDNIQAQAADRGAAVAGRGR